jgi:hypothetical protein
MSSTICLYQHNRGVFLFTALTTGPASPSKNDFVIPISCQTCIEVTNHVKNDPT